MTETVQLNVSGMKCGGCETNVVTKLKAIAGVSAASASSHDKQVNVEFDASKTNIDIIKQTITGAGYQVNAH